MTSLKKIAIIGGGISGLSLAYKLHKRFSQNHNVQIDLFEKNDRLGGTIHTEFYEGFTIEKGPDGFIQQKTTVRDLATELGIVNELITTKASNRRSMILQNGKLVEVPDGFYLMSPAKIFPFLKSPLLSWKGKVRTLLEPFIPAKTDETEESLASFVRRRFGNENLDKISQAMLGGIYTADPEHLSMQAALPRFSEMEKQHGSIMRAMIKNMSKQTNISGARYGLFGSFRNGMSTLIHALAKNIPSDRIHLSTNIDNVRYDDIQKQWAISINNKEMLFDAVCFAIAPHQIAKMMHHLSTEEKLTLQSIPYASSAILHFAFKNEQIHDKPSAVGFIVPHRENKHFIACSLMSNKYDHRAPEGHTLLRVFAGGALQEHILSQSLQELRQKILSEISLILKIQGDPIFDDFTMWPKSMPQYTLGHLERVDQIKKIFTSMPNCHVLGNGYSGVGIPDLIEYADQLSTALLENIFN